MFEDHRLYALAGAHHELGAEGEALEAYLRLIDDHPRSPLRSESLERAVAAARGGQPIDALALIQASRSMTLPDDTRQGLERAAWEIATELGLESVRRETARELLASFPLTAGELQVVETFRSYDGQLDWPAILSPHQQFDRVENLLRADLPEAALLAVDAIPDSHRDLDWSLLKARALTEQELGDAALTVLLAVQPRNAEERARLAWGRAQAALEAGTARRERRSLDSDTRRLMRQAARGYLWEVVRSSEQQTLVRSALETLFEELIDEELFDEGMGILHRLKEIDPDDATGAEYLWRRGWGEYDKRNHSGAIGYWSQMLELYPEDRRARRARYWSARAHESLGNAERAREIYRAIASTAAVDFYSRYARRRIPTIEIDEPATATTAEWPRDRALERAEVLFELGLDELALLEADGLEGIAEKRARHALRAEVLARLDRRRESIQSAWRAFPTLGRIGQTDVPERALRLYYPLAYDELIRGYASERRLPVDLVFAMIRQESAFDAGAHSWAGARGLMQVMPATGRELARRLRVPYSSARLKDPDVSVQLGTEYFRQVLEMFDGNVELALAGYNGGPYRIKRLWREAPPGQEIDAFIEGLGIEETKTYVKRILLFSDSYNRLYFEPAKHPSGA